jgi:hypothetical protein
MSFVGVGAARICGYANACNRCERALDQPNNGTEFDPPRRGLSPFGQASKNRWARPRDVPI